MISLLELLRIERKHERLKAIHEASRKVHESNEKLDCNGVFQLAKAELDALFKDLPKEVLDPESTSFRDFIDMDTMNGDLKTCIEDYLCPQHDRNHRGKLITKKLSECKGGFWRWGVSLLVLGCLGVFFIPRTVRYSQRPKIQANSLTIGTLWTQESQEKLAEYLEKTLIQENYWDFMFGRNRLEVIIDGDEDLHYQEAESQIVNYQWDIVFAMSPMVSISSIDSGFDFVAVMFPDTKVYQSGLFVHKDSEIQSVDDITPQHTLALGDFGKSASSFFMPIYDLYGKTVTITIGNRGSDIREMVKSGDADIGATAISNFGDASNIDDPEVRYIHQSRDIPSSAVFLSPELSLEDRATLKHVLLDAPDVVKGFDNSNYGIGEEPDYEEFKRIIQRVDQVLVCSDFSTNPVKLYCPEGFEPHIMKGRMDSWSMRANSVVLGVSTSDGQIYKVIIDKSILDEVTAPRKIHELQGEILETMTPQLPISEPDQVPIIQITQPTQIKFINLSLPKSTTVP